MNDNEKTPSSSYKGLDNTSLNEAPVKDPASIQSSLHPDHSVQDYSKVQVTVRLKTGVQYFATIAGAFMLVLSVLALISPGITTNLPPLAVTNSYGWFMGLLPMNIVNKGALFVFGIAGLMAMKRVDSSITWSRVVFVAMGVLGVMGLFPETNTMYGMAPLFSTQIPTYGLFAVLGLIFSITGMKDQNQRTNRI